jgi:hypothetical protein
MEPICFKVEDYQSLLKELFDLVKDADIDARLDFDPYENSSFCQYITGYENGQRDMQIAVYSIIRKYIITTQEALLD